MKVLIACEFSGVAREAFTALGHQAMSADLEATEIPGWHFRGDVRKVLAHSWDLMVAFPPYVSHIMQMSPSPDRAKNRSRTYLGLAAAMADQWGVME